jgi:radical SAM protein with 4Fe4S-binding SPASM domain
MDEPTAIRLVNWIVQTCWDQRVQNINFGFLGGEPLGNIDMVFKLHDLTKQLRPPFTGDYADAGSTLYTNGDLLTQDLFKQLKGRRILLRLNPTYDEIDQVEDKVMAIKANLGGCCLAVALDEMNLERLPRLAELVIKHKIQIRTNRLYDGGIIHGYVDEYQKQMAKMFDVFIESGIPVYPDWIMESTLPLWPGPKNPALCGKYFIAVNANGAIRSCNADPDTIIGHIDTHRWEDLRFLQRWSAKNLPECHGCEWELWCQGGCPYTRKLTYGVYGRRSPFCSAFKTLFPKLMEMKKRWLRYYETSETAACATSPCP